MKAREARERIQSLVVEYFVNNTDTEEDEDDYAAFVNEVITELNEDMDRYAEEESGV